MLHTHPQPTAKAGPVWRARGKAKACWLHPVVDVIEVDESQAFGLARTACCLRFSELLGSHEAVC